MRTVLATVATLALVSFAGAAGAETIQSQVKGLHQSWGILLDDGVVYTARNIQTIKDLKVGDRVNVEYGVDPEGERQIVRVKKTGAESN